MSWEILKTQCKLPKFLYNLTTHFLLYENATDLGHFGILSFTRCLSFLYLQLIGSHIFCLFQVFVRDNEAQLFLNDKPVVSFTSHLSPIGRGGVIVAAGVNSVIRIRGLDVAAVEPFFFSFYNCKSHQMIRDQFYILSAPFGTFPDSGFCRAISKQRISGTNYIITARMFNENLYPGSKVGLMFNAQDPYNFDFVNFQ